MTAFGDTAIEQVISGGASEVKTFVIDSYQPELSLFGMLSELPLAALTSTIGIILVIVFFVTSSDSGSLVIDTITAGGKVNAPGQPARVLGYLRGAGRDRPAAWRRPDRAPGDGGVDGGGGGGASRSPSCCCWPAMPSSRD